MKPWVVRPYPHGIYHMREFLEGNLVWTGSNTHSFLGQR